MNLFRNDLIFLGIGLSNTGYLNNLNKVLILRFENMAGRALELQYDAVLKSAKIKFNHTSTYSFKLNLVSPQSSLLPLWELELYRKVIEFMLELSSNYS